ncbi:hypothetical protein BU24DRAFT_498070 [Aaosphaeria arxii CBS 175.79]|uniref:Tat pathway signal sequence n=1 Tax=Aaosphaeria arxii CBS 175.79 TaxID=1450172 RepID=A0A6A5X670_9PLEO|nr:uncharacterized protein BU24DRAFT_498070 [Aaosphaeria arxii CBS 175.79]KAF2008284.1 hypothetical protein BU24DRAFT_498070 [Aaosphaeria arxii CBS 175.79]
MAPSTKEYSSLLNEDELSQYHDHADQVQHKRTLSRINKYTLTLVIYTIIVTGIIIFEHIERAKHDFTPYSPASHLVQYVIKNANPDLHSVYTEHPSDAVDAAWDRLIKPVYIVAEKDEVKMSKENPDDTMRFMDFEGYLGALGVYHNLHCLRRMYWHFHEERYFPNRTIEERQEAIGHALHCLGVIIEDMKCSPNLALYTFGMSPDAPENINYKSKSQRKCVDWDPIHEWATSRSPGYYPSMKAPVNMLNKGRSTSHILNE